MTEGYLVLSHLGVFFCVVLIMSLLDEIGNDLLTLVSLPPLVYGMFTVFTMIQTS